MDCAGARRRTVRGSTAAYAYPQAARLDNPAEGRVADGAVVEKMQLQRGEAIRRPVRHVDIENQPGQGAGRPTARLRPAPPGPGGDGVGPAIEIRTVLGGRAALSTSRICLPRAVQGAGQSAGPVGGRSGPRLGGARQTNPAGGQSRPAADGASGFRWPGLRHRRRVPAAAGRSLGLWGNALPFAPCPILDIDVTDGKPGRPPSPLQPDLDHRAVGDTPFGWIVEARSLRVAINRRLHESRKILLGAPAQAVVTRGPEQVNITVRQRKNSPRGWSWRRMAATASCARKPVSRSPASNTASPPWSAPSRMKSRITAWALGHFLPNGPFAQLPMSGTAEHPNLSAIVFTDKHEIVKRLALLDDARFLLEIKMRLGSHLGAVELVGRRWTYPLSAMYAARYRRHALRADRRRRPRHPPDRRPGSKSRPAGRYGAPPTCWRTPRTPALRKSSPPTRPPAARPIC